VTYGVSKDDRRRYDGRKWTVLEHRAYASHAHPYAARQLSGELTGGVGYSHVVIEDSLEQALVWNAGATAALSRQKVGVFARQDRMPLELPYDTSLIVTPGGVLDIYRVYGVYGLASYKKAGLYLGGVIVADVSDYKTSYYWPRGRLPYTPPERVLVASPLLGRWHGLAAGSSWMFSDTKPYHSPGRNRHQRLFLDLTFDYWSEREYVSLGGIDIWNRSLHDLRLKIAFQIKTFRIFYKIDNMLNRKNAYVPGYFLPGITFRWGFNWMLQG
jgi:hypothetical protein